MAWNDTAPNSYESYFKSHVGECADRISDRRVFEYAAKAAAALQAEDEGRHGFELSYVRAKADELLNSTDFHAMRQTTSVKELRDALRSGEAELVRRAVLNTKERYALGADARSEFLRLSETMRTEGRSEEWKALKAALADENAGDSSAVFEAAERYLKGRKGVSRNMERRESVELAIRAVAICAENGDAVAKQRAQTLADRINVVRGVKRGEKHFVDLEDYSHIDN
jgi:hypothetical protein